MLEQQRRARGLVLAAPTVQFGGMKYFSGVVQDDADAHEFNPFFSVLSRAACDRAHGLLVVRD